MIRLKQSRIFKVIIFFCTLIFAVLSSFSILTAVILNDYGISAVSQQTLVSMITDGAVQSVCDDIQYMLYDVLYENENSTDYLLFKDRYSPENSNVAFEIKDADGKLIFSNFFYSDGDIAENKTRNVWIEETYADGDGETEVVFRENYYENQWGTTTVPGSEDATYYDEKTTIKPASDENPQSIHGDEDDGVYDSATYEEGITGYTDEYYTRTVEYTVNFTLPKAPKDGVRDVFYYQTLIAKVLLSVHNNLLAWGVVSLAAFVVFLVILLTSCGYVKGEEKPVARKLNALPIEIVLCFFAAVCVLLVCIMEGRRYYTALGSLVMELIDIFLICAGFSPVVIGVLYAFTVRIKTKTLVSGLLAIKLFYAAKSFYKKIDGLLDKNDRRFAVFIKAAIAFFAVTLVELLLVLLLWEEGSGPFCLAYILYKIVQLAALFFIALNLTVLQNGAKKIADGNVSFKVGTDYLFGEFRKNAEYLNSVNDGINAAVEQKLKSENMKTELIANVSHDIKTPLTSIINFTELLKAEKIKNEKASEYIEIIDRQSQRLKKLTSDIVEVSKASTGNIKVNPEKTSLGVMLSQLEGEYEDKLKEKNLSLIVSSPEEDVFITADLNLLRRVTDNLMVNICKYAFPGSRVYLLVEKSEQVRIIFKNISEQQLNISPDELTERFVRGDESRNTEGSGLGLAISKSLTELMNGRLEVSIDGDLFKATLVFPLAE